VILCLLDECLTLLGQPAAYWAGDYSRAYEGNPIVSWCLEQHPTAFLVELILWVTGFGTLIMVLPWQLAKTVSLAVALGHIVGAATWLWWEFGQFWLFPPLLLASAGLIVGTWQLADKLRESSSVGKKPPSMTQ
jgi:hypothetical protein